MLIDKIFHLHQPLIETSLRLREPETWREMESEGEFHLSMEGDIGHMEFTPRAGGRIVADIQEVAGSDPHSILFRSVGGDIELAGMIELFEIRENLTEAVLTVDYVPASKLQRAFAALDRFLNSQLDRLERRLEARAGETTAYSGRFCLMPP